MSIAAGLLTPPFTGRADHHGTPCDEGACAASKAVVRIATAGAAASVPSVMKSLRPVLNSHTDRLESFMVTLPVGVEKLGHLISMGENSSRSNFVTRELGSGPDFSSFLR